MLLNSGFSGASIAVFEQIVFCYTLYAIWYKMLSNSGAIALLRGGI